MTKIPPQNPEISPNEEEPQPNLISIARLIYQDEPIAIPVLAEAIDKHQVQTFDDTGRRILATDGDESDYWSKAWAKKHLSIRHNLKIDPIPNDELDAFHDRLAICGDPLDNFGWPKDELPDFTKINPHITNLNKKQSLKTSPSKNSKSWMAEAQDSAKKFIDKHIPQNLFPNQNDVANHVEQDLRSRNIVGPNGPLSASYIKRQVIQGTWWKENKPAKTP